jgi:hypothetical protein
MATNHKYEHSAITREDLIQGTTSWGLPTDLAQNILDKTPSLIRLTVKQEKPHVGAFSGLTKPIATQTARLENKS